MFQKLSDPGLARAAAAEPQATADRGRPGPGAPRPRFTATAGTWGRRGKKAGASHTAPGLRAALTAREPQHLSRRAVSNKCPEPLGTSCFPAERDAEPARPGRQCGGEKDEGLRYLPERHSHVRVPLSPAAGRSGRG